MIPPAKCGHDTPGQARTLSKTYEFTGGVFKSKIFILEGCCCWFTPSLPWDGGMARTAIQVHAINLIELGQGKSGSPFRTSRGCKLSTGSPTTNKADCHWWDRSGWLTSVILLLAKACTPLRKLICFVQNNEDCR